MFLIEPGDPGSGAQSNTTRTTS